jgi:predicted nucleic acid-binding protein
VIAADTSTWIAYLQGADGDDVRLLDRALGEQQVLMPPVVLTEILSDPKAPPELVALLAQVPLIEPDAGYWRRAGELRARVLGRRRKARLGDALIAQSCIDREIGLLTRDRDFRAFEESAELSISVATTLR